MNKIEEGNKMIAQFMQEPYILDNMIGHIQNTAICRTNPEGLVYDEMKYHSSWDWLMPVVEKIEKNGYYVKIETEWVFICRYNDYSGTITRSNTFTHGLGKIHGVWLAVIDFIQWHNATTLTIPNP